MFLKPLKYLKILIALFILFILGTNLYILETTKNQILSENKAKDLNDIDYILVLGAGIKAKRPSPMLEDRLKRSVNLYQEQVSPKILVSGDHINEDYDEVNVMKNYLLENNIPEQSIDRDDLGISTYDSIYRAKYIYHAKNMIIVTQKYHLHRALYIAKALNINAYGIPSNQRKYTNQGKREIREILARTKDFIKCSLKSSSISLEN